MGGYYGKYRKGVWTCVREGLLRDVLRRLYVT